MARVSEWARGAKAAPTRPRRARASKLESCTISEAPVAHTRPGRPWPRQKDSSCRGKSQSVRPAALVTRLAARAKVVQRRVGEHKRGAVRAQPDAV